MKKILFLIVALPALVRADCSVYIHADVLARDAALTLDTLYRALPEKQYAVTGILSNAGSLLRLNLEPVHAEGNFVYKASMTLTQKRGLRQTLSGHGPKIADAIRSALEGLGDCR